MPHESSAFWAAEEALDDGVVVAVAGSAHARTKSLAAQDASVVVAGVGATTVGVMNQASPRSPSAHGVVERLQSQATVVGRADAPADNAARKQVEDNSQVEPAFFGSDVRFSGAFSVTHLAVGS